MVSGRPSTPPGNPTYGVHLSLGLIEEIISAAVPQHGITQIKQLPSGKSFNNRIYFVDVEVAPTPDLQASYSEIKSQSEMNRLVLKVSGTSFGPDKVQNEISSLLLLEKYCPDIPVPRVIAWSENGVTVRRVLRNAKPKIQNSLGVQDLPHPGSTDGHGWILISRRPGRLISKEDLSMPYGTKLMQQLATYMAQWRHQLPKADRIGNIRLVENTESTPNIYGSCDDDLIRFAIDGLLICGQKPRGPIKTSREYYQIKLEGELAKLETEDRYAANRVSVSTMVKDFIELQFPQLSLFSDETSSEITFTHYDLAPRNILVSDTSPPSITGIVDFEFAGFFPKEEEFTNNAISNPDDWPRDLYETFLEKLEKLGVLTPLRGISRRHWQEARSLMGVVENVAPWYLGKSMPATERDEELKKAADRVETGISDLQARC